MVCATVMVLGPKEISCGSDRLQRGAGYPQW
jgi:hypothetical protein